MRAWLLGALVLYHAAFIGFLFFYLPTDLRIQKGTEKGSRMILGPQWRPSLLSGKKDEAPWMNWVSDDPDGKSLLKFKADGYTFTLIPDGVSIWVGHASGMLILFLAALLLPSHRVAADPKAQMIRAGLLGYVAGAVGIFFANANASDVPNGYLLFGVSLLGAILALCHCRWSQVRRLGVPT